MEPLRAQDPRQVGAYRLLGRLGAGGMGEVFLGESPGHRKVAVKLLRAEHAQDARFRERFAREVEAAKRVSGFHTAPVVDADPNDDPPWLVTAYIPGRSLATAIKQDGPLDPEAVRVLGAALAEGVAAIHACGLIHRDIKPGNIILADDGPRIIDFGVARTPGAADLTVTGFLIGTAAFMSPEQVRGERVDARSDVFSLGSVLAYAATGRSPFDADTIPAIVYRIAGREPELDGISGPLRAIIAACLAKDPAARPTLAALTAHLTGDAREVTYVPPNHFSPERIEPPAEVPPPPAPAPVRPARNRLIPAAVSVAALVAAAAGGVLAYELTGGTNGQEPAASGQSGAGAAVAAGTPSATARPAAVPARYLGQWHGTLRNHTGLQGPERATLTITRGGVGATVGHASYPAIGCAYAFRLVSARTGRVTLHETVTSGPCVPEYVILTPSGQGLKDSVYETLPSQGGTPTFTGHLTRGVS